MAVKDTIVPGYVGTTTIKWLPTRGYSIGAAATTPGASLSFVAQENKLEFVAQKNRLEYMADSP